MQFVRFAALAICLVGLVGSCGQGVTLRETVPLRKLHVELPSNGYDDFVGDMSKLAETEGFRMKARTTESGFGPHKMFELRREDMWIIGDNAIGGGEDDLPALSDDGRPQVEYSQTEFDIFFYPGVIPPRKMELNRIVELVESMTRKSRDLEPATDGLPPRSKLRVTNQ